jgi:hypothetical protein
MVEAGRDAARREGGNEGGVTAMSGFGICEEFTGFGTKLLRAGGAVGGITLLAV